MLTKFLPFAVFLFGALIGFVLFRYELALIDIVFNPSTRSTGARGAVLTGLDSRRHLKPNELIDAYLRIQSTLIGFVTPSLVSMSFEVANDEIRVRLVYWIKISTVEKATIAQLERRLHSFFEGRATTEIVFIQDFESPQTLPWPVFRVRKNVEE